MIYKDFNFNKKFFNLSLSLIIFIVLPFLCFAEEFRIIHTNDMHSEFLPSALCNDCHISKTATTIKKLVTPNTLIMDAGDYLEGNIHFNADFGKTSLEFFNRLNYNYLTIGNHDWLLGPDFLFKTLSENSKQKIICANLDFSKYKYKSLAQKLVRPYDIVLINNVRVGIIGVTVYEKIFDIFFDPVKITNPVSAVKKAVKELKGKVDVIIVLAHNGLPAAQKIAKVKGVNIVIAAHDHKPTLQPIKVGEAIVVEAGAHIEHVGAIDVDYDVKNKKLRSIKFNNYKTTNDAEDEEIKELENKMLNQTLAKYGNDTFEKAIGFTELNIQRYGNASNNFESDLSNLAADAYRDFYKTDLSIEIAGFISRDIQIGSISSGDVFNAFPHAIDLKTNKTWTVKKVYIRGKQLQMMLSAGFGINKLNGYLGFSDNVKLIVKPGITTMLNPFENVIQSMTINGQEIEPYRYYSAAVTEGMINVFKVYQRLFIIDFEYVEAEDSKVEHWKVIRNYINKNSPITRDNLKLGRITILD